MLKPSFGSRCLCTLSLAALVAACSSSDNKDGGVIRPKDTGVGTGQDAGGVGNDGAATDGTGAPDMGMVADTGANPDATRPDANTLDASRPDAMSGDAMPRPDGGMAQCTTAANCTAADPMATCISGSTGNVCNGTCADGICSRPCDPFVPSPGCPAMQGCTWLGPMSDVPMMGACVPAGMGGTQQQNCMVNDPTTVSAGNCNGVSNYICVGPFSLMGTMGMVGQCERICRPSGDTLCATLGNTSCVMVQTGIGLCTPQNVTDVGRPCPAAPGMCQGRFCSAAIMGCSQVCGIGNTCPMGTTCIIAGSQFPAHCLFNCTPGAAGDMACMARNPMTPRCAAVGMGGVCAPAM